MESATLKYNRFVTISIWTSFTFTNVKYYGNKKVLLRERKRHTARHVGSTPYVVLSWLTPPPGGWTWPPLLVAGPDPPRGGWTWPLPGSWTWPPPLAAGPDPPPLGSWTWPPPCNWTWPPPAAGPDPPDNWTWPPPPRQLELSPPGNWTWQLELTPPPLAADLTPPGSWTWHPPPPPAGPDPPLRLDLTPPHVDRQTDTCQNITFPILRMRAVKMI